MNLKNRDFIKIGNFDNIARSLAAVAINKHFKHNTKEEVLCELENVVQNPAHYAEHQIWGKLAEHFCPQVKKNSFECYDLRTEPLSFKNYGNAEVEPAALQQINLALRLPIAVQGALMPDAHAGYGLPVGGVLAVENAVIPYAVGVDIACNTSLTIFKESPNHLKRYTNPIKDAILKWTHFGMEGGLNVRQNHEVLERNEFNEISLLKKLHKKCVRQLGTSGSGNHFVEFGDMQLFENNILGLPEGEYMALVSHSGSRGLGAEIAGHYSNIARQRCKLPRVAQHFAWLDIDSAEGEEYWLCMNLAGDYSHACHEIIHANLTKALNLNALANISSHHNFAWKDTLPNGNEVIVHRKGATPAHKNEAGFIPGSMTAAGYLVRGKGIPESLYSASHGAGRAMSRLQATESISRSELKKTLKAAGVTLIGGSVEEAPQAYKNIDSVMEFQAKLVEIEGKFLPRIVRMNDE